MSGILGQILSGVLGGGQQGTPTAITGILQEVLASSQGGTGGVAGLVAKFQAVGLGDHIQSWVGTGANLPISADQVGKVFSSDQIAAWAQKAGTTPEAISGVLAEALPHAVDHVTPDGQVPAQTADISGMLTKLMAGFTAPKPT